MRAREVGCGSHSVSLGDKEGYVLLRIGQGGQRGGCASLHRSRGMSLCLFNDVPGRNTFVDDGEVAVVQELLEVPARDSFRSVPQTWLFLQRATLTPYLT